jgi:hypothetical protein
MFASTQEGSFNMYNIGLGKLNENKYPHFDRTHYQIKKIYAFETTALSLSGTK